MDSNALDLMSNGVGYHDDSDEVMMIMMMMMSMMMMIHPILMKMQGWIQDFQMWGGAKVKRKVP